MKLPENFLFSQSNLQDYIDCRKRFWLRYVQNVAWPAIQAEPAVENERHIRRGERFHHLVEQYFCDVPEATLTTIAEADEDENLAGWWKSFLDAIPPKLEGQRFVEATLSASIGNHRLAATYDLVLIDSSGQATILDWKTGQKKSRRPTLAARLQTRVYPYLLCVSGKVWNQGKPIDPEKVNMRYWFTSQPDEPEVFPYSQEKFTADERYLTTLLTEIDELVEMEFEMIDQDKPCKYCVYRSLCDRGITAGPLEVQEEQVESTQPDSLSLDYDQIAEIEF